MFNILRPLTIIIFIVLFTACGGGGGSGDTTDPANENNSSTIVSDDNSSGTTDPSDENVDTGCENILAESSSSVPNMSIGTTYNELHHTYLAGATIKGTYENEPYSVTLTCDHVHVTQLGNQSQIVGSYVIDYDNNVPTLFLYNKASTGRHTISLDGTDLKTNVSKFDGIGTVTSIERTEECEEESVVGDTGFICSDIGNGYLSCSYKFHLSNTPDNGEIQQKAFHYEMPSAGDLTIELNRWGAHVNLTDGAEELYNFARADDYCEGYNTESTLVIRGVEVPYRELAPDTEVRDMLMTNMLDNAGSVVLKSGIGVAPHNGSYCPTGYYETIHEPFFDGCYGCYGNHCLHHYVPADLGQFQGIWVQFSFYAPKAKVPCKDSVSEGQNESMTSNTGEGHGDDALPPEAQSDNNESDVKYWRLDITYTHPVYGTGTAVYKNFTVDCEDTIYSPDALVGSENGFREIPACAYVNDDMIDMRTGVASATVSYTGILERDPYLGSDMTIATEGVVSEFYHNVYGEEEQTGTSLTEGAYTNMPYRGNFSANTLEDINAVRKTSWSNESAGYYVGFVLEPCQDENCEAY